MIAFIDLPAYKDNILLCSLHDNSVLNSVYAANLITSCNMVSDRWSSVIKADFLSVCLVVVIIAAGREEHVGIVCISKMIGIRPFFLPTIRRLYICDQPGRRALPCLWLAKTRLCLALFVEGNVSLRRRY